jgi:uncharacterized protein (TIGR01244 family)
MNVMNWKEVEPRVFSAGQPGPGDWSVIAANGVRTVINLRPQSEQPGVDAEALVRAHGLDYYSLPVASAADLSSECVATFASLLERLRPEGVVVHCGSGNRVGALFALARGREPGVTVPEALDYGRRAGLTTLESQVAALLNNWRASVT